MRLTFKKYQERTLDTLITDKTKDLLKNDKALLIARLALGVAGEGGEVAEKVKKYLRGDSAKVFLKADLKKEIGDVLWYCSALAYVMDLDLGEIASNNLIKLKKRKEKNKIQGSGDNR